ncbi:MAG: hypothetical protein M1834_005480 [Cirrosporium novae-zelandiae]|nr:MAG: hypothetical protein M1834_005480 [Cirrosporium novae-zelandiae]
MSKQPTLTMPPESFINSPLIQPPAGSKLSKPSSRVSNVIRHLQLRKAGNDLMGQLWIVFQLLPGDFEQLIALIKANEPLWGFLEDKRCSDRFVIRMRSNTYEYFLAMLVPEIHNQLGKIAARTGEAAEFARHNAKYSVALMDYY